MLFDINLDTVEEVLALRRKAKELLAAGQTVISWSNEGSSATMKEMDIVLFLAETKKFLKEADPELYGRNVKQAGGRFQ